MLPEFVLVVVNGLKSSDDRMNRIDRIQSCPPSSRLKFQCTKIVPED